MSSLHILPLVHQGHNLKKKCLGFLSISLTLQVILVVINITPYWLL